MGAGEELRHVLFVDDEPSMHLLVQKALRSEPLRLTCVADGAQALRELECGRLDLVVTTLTLPVVDAVELVRHLANRSAAISLVVVSDRDPPASPPHSPLRFVREPLQPASLAALVRERLAAPPVVSVAVAELAQMVALTRRSCTLRAHLNGLHGDLSFSAGALVGASVGALSGESAARTLLAWRRAMLRLEPLVRTHKTTTNLDLAALLTSHTATVERVAVAAAASVALQERVVPVPATPRTDMRSTDTPERRTPALYLVPEAPPTRPAPSTPQTPVWERPAAQATISALLADAMKIDGAIGAAIGVWELDECLGVQSVAAAISEPTVRTTLSGHSRVLRAMMSTMKRLGQRNEVADVLIMLDTQMHVLAPLPRHDGLFLDLALDRSRSTLALARMRVAALSQAFRLEGED